MNHQSHYRIENDSGCDMAVGDRFLVVNCSGICMMSEPFTSCNKNGRQDYYLIYLFAGELEMDLEGQAHTVRGGSLVIFPPGCAYRYAKRDREELVYFWAHFTGYGAQEMLTNCHLSTNTLYHAGISGDVADSFRHMFQNFINRDNCYESAVSAQLTLICVQLRRKINGIAPIQSFNVTGKIRKSLDFMHRNYKDPITIAELADIEHLSASRYCALFRQCTGVSPQNFLIDLRLKTATELMLGTDLNVKQIARSIGYSDPLYFSRLFKARKGVSPGKYISMASPART
jgi:AraC family transcriptional regulator, arabinose operon regulatory protein